MPASEERVLVLNCGSSSVKAGVVEPESARTPVSVLAERVGTPEATVRFDRDGDVRTERPADPSQRGVVEAVLAGLSDDLSGRLLGVGHRVVHGGERFTRSVLVDDAALAAIRACVPLAPLHNPANVAGIEAVRALFPRCPQVAVFDTAFHARMPPRAYRYAVPETWYREHAVRRYGFHGTSHAYVAEQAAHLLGRPLAELRLVTAHLGNGCSAAAVCDGVSVDTTMGMTPLEGLVMGTRSGDVDPGLFAFIADRLGADVTAITAVLNRESGLLGLSGRSNDMREITAAADAGDERATLTLEVFCYRLARHVAALVVPLGRLDALVFTGGIGEHSARVRGETLGWLGFLGLHVDAAANAVDGAASDGRITAPGGVPALVVATDEELMIARETVRTVAAAEAA